MTVAKKRGYALFIQIGIIISILTNVAFAQENIQKLGEIINNMKFDMPSGFGDPNLMEYTFLNAGCYCSLSQATTGHKMKMNSITTFSFNLSKLKDGRLLISKPNDSNYKAISEDIWTIEIGLLDILVQNTDWQSRQTRTNHFYFYVEGTTGRDLVIEYLKKATSDCGGSISQVSFVE